MTRDDKEIVAAIQQVLADKVGKQRFDLWFGAGTRLAYDGRSFKVGTPNKLFLEWIRSNFRRHIEEACSVVFGRCPTIEFYIDTMASEDNGKNNMEPENKNAGSCAIVSFSREAERTAVCAPDQQRRFASLESFVVGRSNRLALTSAEMVVDQPGRQTPLFFYGPTGVGKTHLLEGIWTSARQKHRAMAVVYLSAEQFTSQFLEALRGSGLPNFRRKYRGVGLLIIDDLQFLVGKRATQVELLHTIDTFIRDGRQLVFAADRAPAELVELGSELITRLTGGLVCRIDPPDLATRVGIVAEMARRMSLQVPREVQQFIAERLTNHARELSGALCRLKAASQALKSPISLSMAQETLADLIRQSGRAVRLPDIAKAVCDVFGLEPEALQSEAKSKSISHPRMLAMWLARKHTRAALSEIGRYFGHRSHSTVVSAQKRVDRWVASGNTLELADHNWHIEDAIRYVEQRLSAG